MITTVFKKVFGSRNQRLLKRLGKQVNQINALSESYAALSDDDLRAKTQEFKQRLAAEETLDSLLPEAFAVVREASVRTLQMRHFDVQLLGGMVLHQGKIAEAHTGEGKTLVATLPAYLNALTGGSVHIVTVNSYLARRDAEWMEPLYNFLGLSVGVIVEGLNYEERKQAYAADITYGTNNEFGFDYLRDNMAFALEDSVQRELAFAIVDEVDSILIDEARTPLIISGELDESSDAYAVVNKVVQALERGEQREDEDPTGDFTVDEKDKQVHITEQGHSHAERLLTQSGLLPKGESLYHVRHIGLLHYLNAALRACHLYQRDVDYIVQNGEVVIVDEHTGRSMPGRRWSEGLHQAVEAKEGLHIHKENQTLASITFQNFFRLYNKLAGMTGTADTEAFEFQQIYGLEVVVMPTNKPMIRQDLPDKVYVTQREKYTAIVEDIKQRHEKGQPVLVGTASIESSEVLSELLWKANIDHQVLNAKRHEKEATIVAQAGCVGAVTIATNMAGRGTDIVLGGNVEKILAAMENPSEQKQADVRNEWASQNQQVRDLGGLHVLGAERNESRRIDNQLRGRSGRQGDPGSSQFYLALDDSLMRIFASDRVAALMRRLGMTEGENIEHAMLNRAIENAQRKVEGHNFDIRKQLLRYDDVANEQRKLVYQQRTELMALEDISTNIVALRRDVFDKLARQYLLEEVLSETWDIASLQAMLQEEFGLQVPLAQWIEEADQVNVAALVDRIVQLAERQYAEKEAEAGSEAMRQLEKGMMLQILDIHWREHLAAMDHLREGIHLRGYAQKNPAQEYRRESFELFTQMLDSVKYTVISRLQLVQVETEEDVAALDEQRRQEQPGQVQYSRAELEQVLAQDGVDVSDLSAQDIAALDALSVSGQPKVGRNQVCPCGSGKKFKRCCGRLGA